MASEAGFAEEVLKAFRNTIKEIEKGSSEHDVRYRFVKYFVEGVLGYESKFIKWEKNRADLTIVDENDFAVLKIETKRPTENIDKPEYEEQAFKYAEDTTRYIGLTNFLRLKLWEVKRSGRELKVDLDFSKTLEQKRSEEQLSAEEKAQILFLNNLTKEALFAPSKYEEFDENYARIDITREAGFRKLLDRLNFIVNDLLLGYTLKAFGEYKEGYAKYQAEVTSAERELKNNKGNHELNQNIARYRQKLDEKYEKYRTFSGFQLWKHYSGKDDLSDDEVREVFCKETIYVFLNKLLFLRICEDKRFLEKSISNGGIEQLREVFKRRFSEESVNKEIIETAFKSGKGIYSRFYEIGILDWFRTGDGELNELLNRVLWILNQFDFAHVDRDILGNLYEKYLPGDERKKLGEFYTPVEVIDYILTAVGYTYSYEIETKDILDPACGSGGFLVRATRRLISRYLMKFGKAGKEELRDPKNWKEIVDRLSPDEAKIILDAIAGRIYGLDINPFACHIAEMNMLIQVIDLYQKAKERYKDYSLNRFKIHRTDSLEKPTQKRIFDYTYTAFLDEQDEIDTIRQKKFDFVVGNPPYVRVQLLDERMKEYIKKEYKTALGKFDIYVPFIERGIYLLKDDAKLGFINPNLFLNREYGKELRKFLLENTIIQIIDFGDSGVFKDVTNYPCILVVQKRTSPERHKIKTIIIFQPKERLLYDIQKEYGQTFFKNEYFSIFEVEQRGLGYEQWKLLPLNLLRVINKLETINKTLKDIIDRIYEGLITGANEVYFVSQDKAKQLKLEKGLLKSVPKGRHVRRWRFFSDQLVIYPHIYVNGKTEAIENLASEYPNTWQYFKDYEDRLKKRTYLIDAIKKGGRKEWFEIWNPRSPNWFNQPKIITPNLSTENNFSYDEEGVFLDHDCYGIILKEKSRENYLYILGLLNSHVLEFYLKQISPYASGKYYRYMTGYLEKLPIKLPASTEEKRIAQRIISKVDGILELHKKVSTIDIDEIIAGQEVEKLCNLSSLSFSLKDDSAFEKTKVEKTKIFINSEDNIEIKGKNVRNFVFAYLNSISDELSKTKDIKGAIYNIPVPKSQEFLEEITKGYSFDQVEINEKIKGLEQEINELVYEIYGIAEEERNIIEETLGME